MPAVALVKAENEYDILNSLVWDNNRARLFHFIKLHLIKQGFTLGKNERLKSRKLLEQLFREGTTFFVHPFKVYYRVVSGAEAPPLQGGFGVSARAFKKATDRNRIKRLTREAYRLQKTNLQQTLVMRDKKLAAFFLYTGKELPQFEMMKDKMKLALQQLENKMNQ